MFVALCCEFKWLLILLLYPVQLFHKKGNGKYIQGCCSFKNEQASTLLNYVLRRLLQLFRWLTAAHSKSVASQEKNNLLFLDATIWRPQTSVFFLDWNVTYHVTFPYRNVYLKGKTKLSSTASTWSDISIWEKTREGEIVDLFCWQHYWPIQTKLCITICTSPLYIFTPLLFSVLDH